MAAVLACSGAGIGDLDSNGSTGGSSGAASQTGVGGSAQGVAGSTLGSGGATRPVGCEASYENAALTLGCNGEVPGPQPANEAGGVADDYEMCSEGTYFVGGLCLPECPSARSYVTQGECPSGFRCITMDYDMDESYCFPDCRAGSDCASQVCWPEAVCGFPEDPEPSGGCTCLLDGSVYTTDLPCYCTQRSSGRCPSLCADDHSDLEDFAACGIVRSYVGFDFDWGYYYYYYYDRATGELLGASYSSGEGVCGDFSVSTLHAGNVPDLSQCGEGVTVSQQDVCDQMAGVAGAAGAPGNGGKAGSGTP